MRFFNIIFCALVSFSALAVQAASPVPSSPKDYVVAPIEVRSEKGLILRVFTPKKAAELVEFQAVDKEFENDHFSLEKVKILDEYGFFSIPTPFTQYNVFQCVEGKEIYIGNATLGFPKGALKITGKEEDTCDLLWCLRARISDSPETAELEVDLLKQYSNTDYEGQIEDLIQKNILNDLRRKPAIAPYFNGGKFTSSVSKPIQAVEGCLGLPMSDLIRKKIARGWSITSVSMNIFFRFPPKPVFSKEGKAAILVVSKKTSDIMSKGEGGFLPKLPDIKEELAALKAEKSPEARSLLHFIYHYKLYLPDEGDKKEFMKATIAYINEAKEPVFLGPLSNPPFTKGDFEQSEAALTSRLCKEKSAESMAKLQLSLAHLYLENERFDRSPLRTIGLSAEKAVSDNIKKASTLAKLIKDELIVGCCLRLSLLRLRHTLTLETGAGFEEKGQAFLRYFRYGVMYRCYAGQFDDFDWLKSASCTDEQLEGFSSKISKTMLLRPFRFTKNVEENFLRVKNSIFSRRRKGPETLPFHLELAA